MTIACRIKDVSFLKTATNNMAVIEQNTDREEDVGSN